MPPTNNHLLNAALQYAESGYPVFPCAPGTKFPLTEHGFHDATVDSEQIERWWTQHPDANIGIATQGLVVIDIDGEHNPWLSDLPERFVELSVGPTAITPRGGSHRVFRQPDGKAWRCTEGRLAPKVDTRANGGYIVAPPSAVNGGSAYQWVHGLDLDVSPDQLPEPPTWLAEQLDRLATDTPTLAHSTTGDGSANQIPSGQRNATLARLGGNMRRVGMSQAEITAALLRANTDRCVPPLAPHEVERIAVSIARYAPDEVAVALVENHWEQMYSERTDEAPAIADPGPLPPNLLRVPGFVNDVIDYTLETAPYPEPVLAFCGALALQGLLASRKVRDPGDSRTSLYLLGLANSGAGKDYPRKVNQKILLDAGLADCLGDTFASGEGIEDQLFVNPAVLFQTDEIDGLMAKINLGKEARHEGIMNVLLKMYTSANSLYSMRVKAGKEHGVIDQPGLCVFGTAIPKHFYEALSARMLSNGFFARLLILEAGKRGQGQDTVVRDLPESILTTARWWSEYAPGKQAGNLATWHPVPKVVEYKPSAAELARSFRAHADVEYSQAEERQDAMAMAIWARANEKALRLALVYACSANHVQPQITDDAVRWAIEFVDHQTRRMLFMAGEHVSENEFDARCKKLVSTLRNWQVKRGDAWMPFWQINRKHPWSEREHEEVRVTLLNQRVIEFQEQRTGGPPQRLYRLTATNRVQ
jgi:hypothetical protein